MKRTVVLALGAALVAAVTAVACEEGDVRWGALGEVAVGPGDGDAAVGPGDGDVAVAADPGGGAPADVASGKDPGPSKDPGHEGGEDPGTDPPHGDPGVAVEPDPIEFQGRVIGLTAWIDVTLRSTGGAPLVVTGLHLRDAAGDSGEFDIEFEGGGGSPAFVIPAGDVRTFGVTYRPADKSPVDPVTGMVVVDLNAVVVETNAKPGMAEVPVSGYGMEVECPQPVVVIEQGDEVVPQTVLDLHGDQSMASSGTIVQYRWTVAQPPENKFVLEPSSTFPNPTHEVNVAGEYEYCLDVCDGARCSDDPACGTTACETVVVCPCGGAIHCELTWTTPGDEDEFDEGPDAGSDMDLHFAHEYATGPDLDKDGLPDPWFNLPYDVFWFNPTPDWESMNPDAKDDPRLDRDDTDGAGPENANLDEPVNGRTYRIGVHYWDDHGYGPAYPRLKCYLWGQLVFDVDLGYLGVPMTKCDLWEVAEVSWPSGMVKKVTTSDGDLKITHNYQNPGFVQIGGGSCAQ